MNYPVRSVTIGNLCREGGGSVQTGPFGSQLKASTYVPIGIPTVMPADLIDYRVSEQNIARIGPEDHLRMARHHLEPGDIVYGRRGDIGRHALVTERERGWLCGTGCLRIRFGRASVDPQFVSYYLRQPSVIELILGKAVGTTMPNLNTSILESVPLELPPLPIQRRIAEILGRLDDKIAVNRRINRTLERMAQALYKHWFVDFGPFQDGEFVESEVGLVPRGWEVVSLEAVFPENRDVVITGPFGSNLHASDYREVGTPLILVNSVMNGWITSDRLPRVGSHKLSELERYVLQAGDIVVTRVGVVGQTAYVQSSNQGWMISGQMLRVRLPKNRRLGARYLAQTYLTDAFLSLVEAHAVGSTRPSLNTRIWSQLKFLLPPIDIQKRFEEIIQDHDRLIEVNVAETRQLATIRDYLLPRLLAGEVI